MLVWCVCRAWAWNIETPRFAFDFAEMGTGVFFAGVMQKMTGRFCVAGWWWMLPAGVDASGVDALRLMRPAQHSGELTVE